MSKVISKRERFADKVYIVLIILSRLLFIVLGLIGLIKLNFVYSVIGVVYGYFIGKWIRYSLGINEKIEFNGYYKRRNDIAMGGNRRLLEFLIEKLRGNEFTVDKCIRITEVYNDFKQKSKFVNNDESLQELLIELDSKTKEISYEKN